MVNLILEYFGNAQLSAILVRTIFALISAFILSLILIPVIIKNFTRKHIGQEVRDDGPKTHYSKAGCPTMGGIAIVISIAFTTLIWTKVNTQITMVLSALILLGLVGFWDDMLKITRRNTKGLSSRQKLFMQFAISAALIAYVFYMFPKVSNTIAVPVLKSYLPIGIAFIPFGMFIIVSFSNSVNLTDGLDGLAAGIMVIVSVFSGALAYIAGNKIYSNYLSIEFISGSGELTVFCAAIAGACMGFLWFNSYPAQIFMGDTGSLGLGGAIGMIAVLIKCELLLAVVGGIFVCEALSVLIQVASFRMTGKRVFKMAPVHHHFELMGWHESKVVLRFWVIAFILALFGVSLLGLHTIL